MKMKTVAPIAGIALVALAIPCILTASLSGNRAPARPAPGFTQHDNSETTAQVGSILGGFVGAVDRAVSSAIGDQ